RASESSRPVFPEIIVQDEGIVSTGQEIREEGESPKAIEQRGDLSEIDVLLRSLQ
ncbi:hypothetical protein U1Q18_032120, partial [Sarracenia purpurea var. burkii]